MEYSSERLAENRERVLEGIRKACRSTGRESDSVTLVAISKFHAAEAVADLVRAGHADFGENYIQEAREKQEFIRDSLPEATVRWHATGHIQTNKAKDVAGRFHLVHTLDSVKLGRILDRLARERDPDGDSRQGVLIQVNIGLEEQKSGVMPEDAPSLLEELMSFPRLDIGGLMCLPPNCGEGEAARPYFAALRKLRDALASRSGLPLPELSMGMSGDFVQAIQEGATMVRVGTDIFGSRV